MTDRSRHAANADPSHESEDSHRTGSREQPDGSRESRDGREDGGRRDGHEGREDQEHNPFAAPQEGEPEKPWQPRHPQGGPGGSGHGESGSRWGSRWSRDQPGRQDGGFGGPGRPEQGSGNGGNGEGSSGEGGGGGRRTPGLRWDPTDPKQRHARYALHGGIWGLFFALFGLIEIGLLLGALSVYWGISALRGPASVRSVPTAHATAEDVAGTARKTGPGADPQNGPAGGSRPAGMEVTVTPAQAAKARKTAAVGGLVAGILTLLGVAANFTQQMVYEEYYTCRQDALTQAARERCTDLPDGQVPPWVSFAEETRDRGGSLPGF